VPKNTFIQVTPALFAQRAVIGCSSGNRLGYTYGAIIAPYQCTLAMNERTPVVGFELPSTGEPEKSAGDICR
jgi:hypothetical protein